MPDRGIMRLVDGSFRTRIEDRLGRFCLLGVAACFAAGPALARHTGWAAIDFRIAPRSTTKAVLLYEPLQPCAAYEAFYFTCRTSLLLCGGHNL